MFDLAFHNKIRKNTPLFFYEKAKILSNNAMSYSVFYRMYHQAMVKIFKKDVCYTSLTDDFYHRFFYNNYIIFFIDYFNLSPIND